MKVLLTGHTSGIGASLNNLIDCTGISRSNGYDTNNVIKWCEEFSDYDLLINNAPQNQLGVLESFFNMWSDNINKQVINIGSYIIDHPRINAAEDNMYWRYRIDKTALSDASNKMSHYSWCCQIINFGPTETPMTSTSTNNKIMVSDASNAIIMLMNDKKIKRLDYFIGYVKLTTGI
jgi:hypothetical protein